MPRQKISQEVVLDWDDWQVKAFLENPNGLLGRELMTRLGEVVTAGAKRRALRRTGRMASEITFRVARDGHGVYTDVYSPARDPQTGFPYPVTHEGRRVRDRRAHRSLRPALRDIRRILS